MSRCNSVMSFSDHDLSTRGADLFNKFGYLIVKDVLTDEEAKALRSELDKAYEENGPITHDLMSHPTLRNFLLDEKVNKVVRSVLGEDMVYFGLSSANSQSHTEEPTAWHNDSKGSFSNPNDRIVEDPASSEWPVYRLGIYLQDHEKFSGGLKLREKSHRSFFKTFKNIKNAFSSKHPYTLKSYPHGRLINIPSRPTDVVLFNLRTHHAGRFKRLKLLPNFALHTEVERFLFKNAPFVFRQMEKPRRNIFIAYAKNGEKGRVFMRNRGVQKSMQEGWGKASFHESEARNQLAKLGIEVDDIAVATAAKERESA